MGCLKSIVGFVLLVILAGVLFLNRDVIVTKWHELRGHEPVAMVASPELANRADVKLTALRGGRAQRIAFSELELQSLLQYKYRQLLPAFVDSPRVTLKGNRIEVKARVPVDRLPQVNELGEAAAFLPDTTEVAVRGELLPLRKGRVALAVDQVSAARIPLPQRLVAGALRKLGRKDEPGLPRDAMAVPLPGGAEAAYVRGDSLIFLANGKN